MTAEEAVKVLKIHNEINLRLEPDIALKAVEKGIKALEKQIENNTKDLVEVVRCKDCIHAVPFDKNCEINTKSYRHCNALRGEETNNVWHKYTKYYKDYSVVDINDFCSCGIRNEE